MKNNNCDKWLCLFWHRSIKNKIKKLSGRLCYPCTFPSPGRDFIYFCRFYLKIFKRTHDPISSRLCPIFQFSSDHHLILAFTDKLFEPAHLAFPLPTVTHLHLRLLSCCTHTSSPPLSPHSSATPNARSLVISASKRLLMKGTRLVKKWKTFFVAFCEFSTKAATSNTQAVHLWVR